MTWLCVGIRLKLHGTVKEYTLNYIHVASFRNRLEIICIGMIPRTYSILKPCWALRGGCEKPGALLDAVSGHLDARSTSCPLGKCTYQLDIVRTTLLEKHVSG